MNKTEIYIEVMMMSFFSDGLVLDLFLVVGRVVGSVFKDLPLKCEFSYLLIRRSKGN